MGSDVALLVFYLVLALGVSFACSIFEAVLLSISPGYVAALEKQGAPAAKKIANLKADIDKPLAAILSLNTIAHTVGAAGVGAQSAKVFESVPLAVISGVLTVLILLISEIIPKSLGAMYWKKLAPGVAALLGPITLLMTWTLFVPAARAVTAMLGGGGHGTNPSREEISAIAEQGAARGVFPSGESRVLSNLFRLTELRATDVMTPRTVVFSLGEDTRVGDLVDSAPGFRFSRIPIHRGSVDQITGYVLRNDILLRLARGEHDSTLVEMRRELLAVPETTTLSVLLEGLLEKQAHLALVVGKYGGTTGIHRGRSDRPPSGRASRTALTAGPRRQPGSGPCRRGDRSARSLTFTRTGATHAPPRLMSRRRLSARVDSRENDPWSSAVIASRGGDHAPRRAT